MRAHKQPKSELPWDSRASAHRLLHFYIYGTQVTSTTKTAKAAAAAASGTTICKLADNVHL